MRSLERIVALLLWCSSVCPAVSPSRTGVHCDHTVHVGADLSLWLDSLMFWAPYHRSLVTYSQPSFPLRPGREDGVWTCKLGLVTQKRLKIVVMLLLSANRKYIICHVNWHSNGWPWMVVHTKINIIRIARYLCGSRASCLSNAITSLRWWASQMFQSMTDLRVIECTIVGLCQKTLQLETFVWLWLLWDQLRLKANEIQKQSRLTRIVPFSL